MLHSNNNILQVQAADVHVRGDCVAWNRDADHVKHRDWSRIFLSIGGQVTMKKQVNSAEYRTIRIRRFCCIVFTALLLGGCRSPQPVSPFAKSSSGPFLLAHRGVSQTFDRAGLDNLTCTAKPIHPPTNEFLENTISSMSTVIKAGADVIELDVHPTIDGEFAVFHDWTLECRTNGTGRTRDHSMAELKALDIGFGYTADGGKTFPFKGKGVGLMPSLSEVLIAFPNQRFLINVKSNFDEEGELLATYLNGLPKERRQLIAVYGGSKPVAVIRKRVTDIITMSRSP